ncbi:ATP-dependent DNA helicase [Paenibacillus physcomitrellae]|uniref:ATP-dependent helicase n=1 Tax=Paenibacillus physcomitrellae TaxID=1619311 RepID=A0ABQ1FWZ2_9BACL|nr:ATP-dependent DNA helicase [Paenibacillus physcomitrellae]GGA32300.1 ATP-dependent helicase [Paenibacillus physcomitrellae]
MSRYPFEYDPSRPFIEQAGEWIGDVFYDVLPEAGFEIRDEQIYMAYQLERAFADKAPIFAEAGVGTGKTLVYLLYSFCYARYTRKPAVIACADESLIEQLVKPEGDIAKLARHLGLEIDARLAKSPDQYLCLKKLDQAQNIQDDSLPLAELYGTIPDFVHAHAALQEFHPYGDRRDYPDMTDEQWSRVNWDSFQDCFACDMRHRCGQTLSRDHYRKAADLIICSHDYYMEHVWTYEGRKREGQLPLLPEHCAVVFDEGHLLEGAAMKALGYRMKHTVFEELISRLLQNEIRETLAVLVDEAIMQSERMFAAIRRQSRKVPGSDRMSIELNPALLREVHQLRSVISAIEEELVFEGELYTIDSYQLRIVEEHLEMMGIALRLFEESGALICWAAEEKDGLTLSVMPRNVKQVLEERVFSQRMPVIFSSATMSVGKSFAFMADSLGIKDYLSFSVDSPYDYETRMKAYLPEPLQGDFEGKIKLALRLIRHTEGRALVLLRTQEELRRFKAAAAALPELAEYRLLFEGDREISHLISDFQNDEHSILAAVRLWEGLDIPGPSLSNVIIWSLPYPPNDPVFAAKRSEAADPFEEVDLPYMLLRLKQGIGRLIRSSSDEGIVMVMADPEQRPVHDFIGSVLPKGVELNKLEENTVL